MSDLGHLTGINKFTSLENVRQKNFLTAAMLIGVYGGFVAYRTYTHYVNQIEARKEEVARVAVEADVVEETVILEPAPATASELQLPRIREPVRPQSTVQDGHHDSTTYRATLGDD